VENLPKEQTSRADFRLRQRAKEMDKDLEGIRDGELSLTLWRTRDSNERGCSGNVTNRCSAYILWSCAFLFCLNQESKYCL